MERWIEKLSGYYPDGFPKSKYIHESCEHGVEQAYPYCPYCGKKITHIKLFDSCLKKYAIEYLTKQGFICE